MALRTILLAAALAPLSIVACSSSDSGTVTASGPHHHFVVNKAFIPKNSTEARMYGLDLNGDKSVDNQLGMVLGTLGGQGFDIQAPIDTAINDGSLTLLVDIQTADFMASSGAGMKVLLGDVDPSTPACNGSGSAAVCGKQLDGNGKFANVMDTDASVTGKIVGGTFNGGPGNLDLKLSLAGADVNLALIGARAQATGMSDAGITSAIVAGAVTQDDLNTKILPAIQSSLGPLITRDCGTGGNPNGTPKCGCADGSTGKTIISLFDTSPADCMVTVSEIQNNGLIMSLLQPDVTIDGQMALSVGIKVTAVKGTYTVPGEM